jgi:TPP-dependent indolepyruvate ferredoxin oxidoreductase alpha subunit
MIQGGINVSSNSNGTFTFTHAAASETLNIMYQGLQVATTVVSNATTAVYYVTAL